MQPAIAITAAQRSVVTQRVTLVGAATNFILSVAQVIIGILGNSQALVADAMHTFSDLLSDGLAYWTSRHSHVAPDDEHPYGHARFECGCCSYVCPSNIPLVQYFRIAKSIHREQQAA